MIGKLKNMIIVAIASFGLLVPAAAAVTVASAAAVTTPITNSVCQGVNNAVNNNNSSDCGTAGSGGTDLSTIASKIVNLFSIVVGIIAVIMIIYGGFRYITSGGESSNVGNAKNTIIFAIVGLIIVALAQFIVHFVLNTTSSSVTTQ